MATPTGIATAARQAASGFALRALPRRKTYTTSWDINAGAAPQQSSQIRNTLPIAAFKRSAFSFISLTPCLWFVGCDLPAHGAGFALLTGEIGAGTTTV